MKPTRATFEENVKVLVTGPPFGTPPVSSKAIARVTSLKLSKDLINQMSSSVDFTLEDAEDFYNQFVPGNPIQHGGTVEVYLRDISGDVVAEAVDGWIKKFTGSIIDPNPIAGPGSRAMSLRAVDKLWAVMNATGRVVDGTPTESVMAHLEPIDETLMIWQIIDKAGDNVIELDETTLPIITRFVQANPGVPDYSNPFPASPMEVLPPNDYDVNYALGRVVFKEGADVGVGAYVYGFNVVCYRYNTAEDFYLVEDAIKDFLESTHEHGGPQLTYGVDFDFFDLDGDARSTSSTYAITGANGILNYFTIAGDHTAEFLDGEHFSGVNTVVNDKMFSCDGNSVLVAGPATRINVNEDVVGAIAGSVDTYANTGIKVSSIDWDEDSGTGNDYVEMLREAGVMPYNYFIHCDVDNFIRCEYIFQKTTEDIPLSGELVVSFPNSLSDVFSLCKVFSQGNTYPTKLITTPLTLQALSTFYDKQIPYGVGYEYGEDVSVSDELGYIKGWHYFGAHAHVTENTPMTYWGFATRGRFQYGAPFDNDIFDVDAFYYPFPHIPPDAGNVPPVPVGGGGQDDFVFFDKVFDDETDIDKILLQMYIPKIGDDGLENTFPAMYMDGDARRDYESQELILGGMFRRVWAMIQTPLMSVTYGKLGDAVPNRGLGDNATAFTMDPMKCDTKIIKVKKATKVKTLRVVFHRPLVVQESKQRFVAMYFLNQFQAYDRGTIYLPGVDVAGDKRVPFARITGTDVISSLIGETGNLSAAPLDDATFQMPNSTLTDLVGTFVCVPEPSGAPTEPYIAEVLFTERDFNQAGAPTPGTMTVHTLAIDGKPHTKTTNVQNGDTAYFMNNRYWLDLLYDRVDLYREQLFNKLDVAGLPWKVRQIENDEITDLGTALRKAVSVVAESIVVFNGAEVSLAYRPDYDVGLTVREPLLNTPRYLITALDYVVDSSIIVNAKIINYDQVIG